MKYTRGNQATDSHQKGRKPWRPKAQKRTETFGFQGWSWQSTPWSC